MNVKRTLYLAGGWGYGNKGDNAILASMLKTLAARFPAHAVVLTSHSPAEVRIENGVDGIASLHALLRRSERAAAGRWASVVLWRIFGTSRCLSPALRTHYALIRDADVLVLGGGGYFNDRWRSMLWAVYLLMDMAAAANTPVVIYGQTLGPFSDRSLEGPLRHRLRRVAGIGYRDAQSERAARVSRLGPDRARLTADEANLTDRSLTIADQDHTEIVVGVMCQNFRFHNAAGGESPAGQIHGGEEYVARLCQALTDAKRRMPTIRYRFITSTAWDRTTCHRVCSEVGVGTESDCDFHDDGNVEDFVRRRQSVDVMLSTNMHPVILAATASRPSIALSYHYKLDDYMTSIGLSDLTLRIDDFASNELADMLIDAVERRHALAAVVQERHSRVRDLARGNADLLETVLGAQAST